MEIEDNLGCVYSFLIKTETYICNLDGCFHRDREISEKILEGSAGKFWLHIRS